MIINNKNNDNINNRSKIKRSMVLNHVSIHM